MKVLTIFTKQILELIRGAHFDIMYFSHIRKTFTFYNVFFMKSLT